MDVDVAGKTIYKCWGIYIEEFIKSYNHLITATTI